MAERVVASIHQLHGAHYRCQDPLGNLRIKVTLKRAAKGSSQPAVVSLPTPPGSGGGGEQSASQSSRREAQASDAEERDEHTFTWQEKLFSRREEEMYSDRGRCVLMKEVNYHNLLHERRERLNGKRPTDRLFSYIDQDNFADKEELGRPSTTAADEKPSFLTERLMTVTQRHLQGQLDGFRPSRDNCGRVQPVATWKTDTRLAVAHTSSTPCQHMYIMADLTPNHLEPTASDEYVLCSLKIDVNEVLTVQPDFNNLNTRSATLLSTSTDGRIQTHLLENRHQEVFEFSIEHVSQEAGREVEQKEKELMREVHKRRTDMMAGVIGIDFDPLPGADCARVVLLGEIIAAERFNASTLFIRYVVSLPDGWQATDDDVLSGCTQLSSTSFFDWSGVVSFALPLEMELIYCDSNRPPDQLVHWPEIFFEVCSVDYWQRQHVEGYASMSVPNQPGMHKFELSSWRPVHTDSWSMMQEFFIGGTPQLDDISYAAVPSTGKASDRLSRYGFQTETTGVLNIRMCCIHQSCSIQEKHRQQRVQRLAAQTRSSVTATSASMMSVLEAFQQAKKKMQSARQGVR